jgi:hypothetical protein
MGTWEPISESELKELLARQLQDCDASLRATYEAYRVEPYQVPISRFGKWEQAFVVARKGLEVMYYEDVEEGFNLSRLTLEGSIMEPGYNQDELKFALQRWQ